MARDGMLSAERMRALGTLEEASARDAWEELLLDFLDQISLTDAQYELIEQRYSTIAKIIDTSKRHELQGAVFLPQGSFRTRTVIRPAEGPVDVDAVTWLKNNPALTAQQVYDVLWDELDERVRTEQDIEEKNRCVRIVYAGESPAFHMDVTPAVNAPGNPNNDGSGQLRVPDKKAIAAKQGDGFKPSNPVDFAAWVQSASQAKVLLKTMQAILAERARARVEPLPSQQEINAFDPLRATIKLLKAHRDEYFARRNMTECKPISVLITTLAGKSYLRVATMSRAAPMTPLEAITAIVREMPQCFDAPRPGERYRVENPVNSEENFAEKWNHDAALPRAFLEWRDQVTLDLQLGMVQFETRADFAEEFDRAFGHRSKTLAESSINKALRAGGTVLGMNRDSADRLRNANALNTVFGVKTDPRTKRQTVDKLDRLG